MLSCGQLSFFLAVLGVFELCRVHFSASALLVMAARKQVRDMEASASGEVGQEEIQQISCSDLVSY